MPTTVTKPYQHPTIARERTLRLDRIVTPQEASEHARNLNGGKLPPLKHGCRQCGNYASDHGRATLYRYGSLTAQGIVWETGSFCSLRCFRHYYHNEH